MKKVLHYQKVFDVNCIDLNSEGLLYKKTSFENKVIINLTGMAIWDLIDGVRTLDEIAQEMALICEIKSEDIEKDVYELLESLEEFGFIEKVTRPDDSNV